MKTPYHNVPNLQKIADLEVEIARLKAEYLKLDEQLEQALRKNESQATLIARLVDWIERLWPSLSWGDDESTMGRVRELIQRAREVTK